MSTNPPGVVQHGHAFSSGLLNEYPAFAVDLDGVVWRGGELIEGAVEALRAIRQAGKRLLLLTNNGSYAPQWVANKLNQAGADIEPSEVLTSTLVAIHWMKNNGLDGKPVFVLGPNEVAAQLEGIVEVVPIENGAAPSVVLAGRYTELTYDRLSAASTAIRNGAAFVALNNDPIMPVPGGFVPGTGAIVAALQAASGSVPTVLGKPEPPMMQTAAGIMGVDGVLMVGDRLEADVVGARSIGWDAALVFSGIANSETPLEPVPDHIAPSLSALLL